MVRLLGRREAVEKAKEAQPSKTSLIASAVEVTVDDLVSWRNFALGRDEAWQRELWRLYELVPEFRFSANWVGAMCSRVRIYVAEVDENGKVGPETEDVQVQALADNMLGGPANKSELLRLMGINFTVTGEFYIVGLAERMNSMLGDQWFVVSPTELQRWAGSVIADFGFGTVAIRDNIDMLLRVWTPHPRRVWLADSPGKACIQILVEIERLTRFIFSQIDSRLFGAGLLAIPAGMDPPPDWPKDEPWNASDTLFARLAEAGEASLKGEGSALAMLPILAEFPPEALDKLKYMTFDSPLSQQALALRKEAIDRLAVGMDLPKEAVTGQGEMNHWSAWFVDENGVKVHIEPIMTRVCQALTKAYLAPALKVLGKDPKKYTYWFDTAGLTPRPTRLADAVTLYKEGIISEEAVRDAGYFRDDEAMSAEEKAEVFGKQLALRDPSQFLSEPFRDMIGITDDILPTSTFTPPPPPPAPDRTATPPLGVVPERSSAPAPVGQGTNKPAGTEALAASATLSLEMALVASTNVIAEMAMQRAGKKLLDRANRGRWGEVPAEQLHTKITVRDADHAKQLLLGAFDRVDFAIGFMGEQYNCDEISDCLRRYCADLLVNGALHTPDRWMDRLRHEGII